MNRTNSLLVAALLAAVLFVPECPAQLAKNTNRSRKLGSSIAGGSGNVIQSNAAFCFVGGGQGNLVFSNSTNSVVGGGSGNFISNSFSFVGGGVQNRAMAWESTVGGGAYNYALSDWSTVAGGFGNDATGEAATIAGGYNNANSAPYGTIGGGRNNSCSGGGYQTVGGGSNNLASAPYATVPGGARCKADKNGSFVWSGDERVDTYAFDANTFTVRAAGGVRFITTINSVFTEANTNNGVYLGPGENSWSALSDSNAKTVVAPVDSRQILRKLVRLPVTRWHYKGQPGRSYIGPMAQDFHAAFGLGHDDKRISTSDTDGVMYAAIQGLVEELKERDKAMAARDETIEELKTKLEAFEKRLDSLPPAPAR